MKALITGGAGFIGSTLARRLIAEGHDVRVLDIVPATLPLEVDSVVGDICDADIVNRAAAGCDVIFHQAAIPSVVKSIQDPRSTMRVGVDGFLNVLLAANRHGIPRIVAASSSAVYGDSPESPKIESMTPTPKSPYALSKLASEQLASMLGPQLGVTVVSLRYFNVYGPGQAADSDYAAVIPRFIELCIRGRRPTIFGDGFQTRDFIHVDDVATANICAATSNTSQSLALNVGSGQATSLVSLLGLIGATLGVKIEPHFADDRPGDIRHSVASIDAAMTTLGFRASMDLATGIAQLIPAMMSVSLATHV